ncbi:GNAT family N-acetyltransferase, partial [Subdoligranulum variabile]
MQIRREGPVYTLYKEKTPIGTARLEQGAVRVEIDPAWRRRGYGSYLLKELLRHNGGLDPKAETRFTAPLPADDAARALAEKFDFRPDGTRLVRRRVPDLSAVGLCHEFLTAHLAPGGFCIDATCGNGHDTEFLCRLAGPQGRVLALDIQPRAVEATNAR